MFTHCWTMRAWGWQWYILRLACLSSICCSFSLRAAKSSWFFSRKIPLPWFRPVGLQIHIQLSLFLTPGYRHRDIAGTCYYKNVWHINIWRKEVLLCLEMLWMRLKVCTVQCFPIVLCGLLFYTAVKCCAVFNPMLNYLFPFSFILFFFLITVFILWLRLSCVWISLCLFLGAVYLLSTALFKS